MASHVRRAKNPSSSISHHGLIKLLVLCSLEKQGRRWDEITIVDEEGLTMEVSAQRGGAMDEHRGMHVDKHNNPESQKEQDVVDASNAKDQTYHDEISQNVGHAYNSPPANPRNDGHEGEFGEK